MSEHDDLDALRAEVAALREEVRTLREAQAQVPWWQQHGGGIAAGCSCGSTAGCQVHPKPWPGNVWIGAQNACAAAAPVPHSYIVNTTCALPAMIPAGGVDWYAPAAGCNPAPQVLTFTVPAG